MSDFFDSFPPFDPEGTDPTNDDDDYDEESFDSLASQDINNCDQVIASSEIGCSCSIHFCHRVENSRAMLFCFEQICKEFAFCNRELTEAEWFAKLELVSTIMPRPEEDEEFGDYWANLSDMTWFDLLEVDGMDINLLAHISDFEVEALSEKAASGFKQKLKLAGAILKTNEPNK